MDIKYAYYNTSKGYRVLGGTAVHFLKADGSLDGTEYIDKISTQNITGTKRFYTSGGNNYDNNSLHIASSDGSDPAITFNKIGTIAGQLKMNVAGYHFLNPGLGYYPVNAAGYVKSGSDDSYLLTGGGGHKAISDFALSSQLGSYVPYTGASQNVNLNQKDLLNIKLVQSQRFNWTGTTSTQMGKVTTESAFYNIGVWGNNQEFGYGISTNQGGGLDIMANQGGQSIRFWAGTDNSNPYYVGFFNNEQVYFNPIINTASHGSSLQWLTAYNKHISNFTKSSGSFGDVYRLDKHDGSFIDRAYYGIGIVDTRNTDNGLDSDGLDSFFPNANNGNLANKMTPIFHADYFDGGDWKSSIIMRGWSGQYRAWRITGNASYGDNESDFYLSQSKSSDGTWLPYRKIWTDGNSYPLNNGYNNTLKTITISNYNDIIDGSGKIWLGDIYDIPTSTTGMQSVYGTIFNLNGLNSHDKTQLIFNGQNGHIQYRKSFYNNTPWTSLRTLWDSDNLPNPVAQSDLSAYLRERGTYSNGLTANSNYPLSITDYGPSGTGFQSTYGTSFHFKGENTWHNRLDFPTSAEKLFLYQGINTTDMSLRGYIDLIPAGVTNWTSNNFNPSNYVNKSGDTMTGALNAPVIKSSYFGYAGLAGDQIMSASTDTIYAGNTSLPTFRIESTNDIVHWKNGVGPGTVWTTHNLNLQKIVTVGGVNDQGNSIYLAWTGSNLQLTVDSTTIGNVWHSGNLNLNNYLKNGLDNTLKTITDTNYNNIDDGAGKIWLGDVYNISTSVTGMDSIYGTIFNINGLNGHDKTQLIFNGNNGNIQYRKSFYNNTPWTPLRTIWDSNNFNPTTYVTQSSLNTQLSNYATLNGVQTFTNTIAFTQSPVVPSGTLGTHVVNLNQLNTKANALENGTGIGFAAGLYPTDDGGYFPYIYHGNPGSNTPFVPLATHGFVDYRLQGYALKNGSNATDTWVNQAFGLSNNPAIPGRTMNATGTVELLNATYGTTLGMINTAGTANGNPTDQWYHRIKMLHNNSAGYYTELFVQMTGGNSLWYKRFENGIDYGTIQVWDKENLTPAHVALWDFAYGHILADVLNFNDNNGDWTRYSRQDGGSFDRVRRGISVIDARVTGNGFGSDGTNGYLPPSTNTNLNNKLLPWFHNVGGKYVSSIIMKGWTDSYRAWKITGPADTSDTEEDFYLSQTNSSSGLWQTNRKIWTDRHFTQANINSWNSMTNSSIQLNVEFTTNLGTGLMLSDDRIGGESGLIDIHQKAFIAGKINEYYKYGSSIYGVEGINYNCKTQLFGMGREANKTDKLTVEGSVKASQNFKSEDEEADTMFIPDGQLATLRDEIINEKYAIRLDPHEYEIDAYSTLEVDDRNRLIHIIGEQVEMRVNFNKIYPKQQIVIYNFDQKDLAIEVQIYGQARYKVEARSFLRLYVTNSLRVIAERLQPCEFIW